MDIDEHYYTLLLTSITAGICVGSGTGSVGIGAGCFFAILSIGTTIRGAAGEIIRHLPEIKS